MDVMLINIDKIHKSGAQKIRVDICSGSKVTSV